MLCQPKSSYSSFLFLSSVFRSVLGTCCECELSQLLCFFRSHNIAKGLVIFSIKVYVGADLSPTRHTQIWSSTAQCYNPSMADNRHGLWGMLSYLSKAGSSLAFYRIADTLGTFLFMPRQVCLCSPGWPRTRHIKQAGLKHVRILPPLWGWGYRHAPPCLT